MTERARYRRAALVVAVGLVAAPVVAGLLASGIWTVTLAYHALLALAVISVPPRRAFGRQWPRAGRACVRAVPIIVALAAGVVAVAFAVRAVWDFTPGFARWHGWGLEPPRAWLWLAYYAVVNPWVEEAYWRGSVLDDVTVRTAGRPAMVALAAGGFVAHHAVVMIATWGIAAGIALSAPILAAGIGFTLLRLRTGGLFWPIATHAGADWGLVAAYLALAGR